MEMWVRGGTTRANEELSETPKTETLLSYATQQLDACEDVGRVAKDRPGLAGLTGLLVCIIYIYMLLHKPTFLAPDT